MAVNKGIENTLAAFGHAVEVGCTYLETDVHATSDGVLLAFHNRGPDGRFVGAISDPMPLPRL